MADIDGAVETCFNRYDYFQSGVIAQEDLGSFATNLCHKLNIRVSVEAIESNVKGLPGPKNTNWKLAKASDWFKKNFAQQHAASFPQSKATSTRYRSHTSVAEIGEDFLGLGSQQEDSAEEESPVSQQPALSICACRNYRVDSKPDHLALRKNSEGLGFAVVKPPVGNKSKIKHAIFMCEFSNNSTEDVSNYVAVTCQSPESWQRQKDPWKLSKMLEESRKTCAMAVDGSIYTNGLYGQAAGSAGWSSGEVLQVEMDILRNCITWTNDSGSVSVKEPFGKSGAYCDWHLVLSSFLPIEVRVYIQIEEEQ